METTGNLQASRARLAAARAVPQEPVKYAGSNVKDALRCIGLLNLACGVMFGVFIEMQGLLIPGCASILGGLVACALFFALAAIVENLIAIRRNTES